MSLVVPVAVVGGGAAGLMAAISATSSGASVTLLEGTTPESFVSQHVEKRGQGIQHMGVEVDDLDAFIKQLEDGGARVSNYTVREGVRKEALISPRSAFGIIMQPIEWLGAMKHMPHPERIVAAGRMDLG